jgi:hypothetical protein
MLYALGEIALVVVGILIALSINNWSEEKKERIKEREILIDLVENLEINIETLEVNIEQLRSFDQSSKFVLASLYDKRPYVDSMQVHFHQARIPKYEFFLSQTGYEEYKDIGLQIITNKDLKDEIINLFETIYPSESNRYKSVNKYLPDFDDHVVQNFIYANRKLKPIDYPKLLSDHYYISWIRAYKEGRNDLIEMENNLITETTRVLNLIQDELK